MERVTAWQALKGIASEAWLGIRYAAAPPGGRLWRVHHRLKGEWDSHTLQARQEQARHPLGPDDPDVRHPGFRP